MHILMMTEEYANSRNLKAERIRNFLVERHNIKYFEAPKVSSIKSPLL